MASIMISTDSETPSVVDVGERPIAKKVTLVMGNRTEEALINLVNERRNFLREQVSDEVPVVGPVGSVEDALLDAIGGIGAEGGSKWFRHNFSNLHSSNEQSSDDQDLTESTLLIFHHHNDLFLTTHVFIGWYGSENHIRTLWHTKEHPISKGFGSGRPPIPFMLAANNYDVVGEITGRNHELQELNRKLPSPTTSEMFKEARQQYEDNMVSAYHSEQPIGVVVEHPPGVVFHTVHTDRKGHCVVERFG